MKLDKLKTLGMFSLDVLVVTIGTAVVESPITRLIKTHSIAQVLCKESILSVLIATLLGFGMYRTWRSRTAKYVWVVTTAWFLLGTALYFGSLHGQVRVFAQPTFWLQFSGAACDTDSFSCVSFFVFTIPLIRSIGYSAGAVLSSRLYGNPPVHVESIKPAFENLNRENHA